jgi:hypothetical protein
MAGVTLQVLNVATTPIAIWDKVVEGAADTVSIWLMHLAGGKEDSGSEMGLHSFSLSVSSTLINSST